MLTQKLNSALFIWLFAQSLPVPLFNPYSLCVFLFPVDVCVGVELKGMRRAVSQLVQTYEEDTRSNKLRLYKQATIKLFYSRGKKVTIRDHTMNSNLAFKHESF